MADSPFTAAMRKRTGGGSDPFAAAMRKRVSAQVEKQLPGGDVAEEPAAAAGLSIGRAVGAGVMELAGGEYGPMAEFVGGKVVGAKGVEGVTLEQATEASIGERMARQPEVKEVIAGTLASMVAGKLRGAGLMSSVASAGQDRSMEAFARGLQQATVTGGDDFVTNATAAVTQGPVNMAEFMLLGPAAPASFFLQGAGQSAFEIEEAAKRGEMEYSRGRQLAGAAIGGGIETATEMVGGAVTARFARTAAMQVLERGLARTSAGQVLKTVGAGAASEGGEEAAASLATNYVRKPVTGEKVKDFPDALKDALVEGAYGALGGVSGAGTALPISMAQQAKARDILSKRLVESQTEFSDPKYWERIAPTTVASLEGMDDAQRQTELKAAEEASIQARGDLAMAQQKAASIMQLQGDAAKRLAQAKKKKDAAAVAQIEQQMNVLVAEADQHQKDMAVLAADKVAADMRLAATTAFVAQRRPTRKMTIDEIAAVEQATMASPKTDADVAAMRELSSLGYDVVFYEDANDERQAFFHPASPNTLFIRAGNDAKTLGEVIGIGYEEALHSIQLTDGRLWQALRSSFDEKSVIDAAIQYFAPLATMEDRVAVAAATAALNGDKSGNMDHIMRRWGSALMEAEGTANHLRDGITTLFRTGQAPGLLGRILARTGLRGRQAATALKVRQMIAQRARTGAVAGEMAGRVREAQAGIAAIQRVEAEAARRTAAGAPAPAPAAPAAPTAPAAPAAPVAPAPVPTAGGMTSVEAAVARTDNLKTMVNLAVREIRSRDKKWAEGKRLYPILEAMQTDPASLSPEDLKIGNELQAEMETQFGPDFRTMWARRRRVATEQDRKTWRQWLRWSPVKTEKGDMVGVPQWVKTSKDLVSMRKLLRKLVIEGESGRYWYEDSVDQIMEIVNGDPVDAEKFVQLLAIYSPNTNVWVNTIQAVRAYTQWKSGVPKEQWTQVSSEMLDSKAKELLYDNQNWDGRKTNSFYQNLMYGLVMKHPDKFANFADEARATIDVWMARAFGYANDSFTDDKGRGGYTFAENEVRRLTAELNGKLEQGEDIWTPHQVQAAIWTAMKTRYELPDVKRKTNNKSISEGLITFDGNKPVYPTTAAGKRQHGANWRGYAMAVGSKRVEEEARQNGRSFADDLQRMMQVVTWEAIPSSDLNNEINRASIRTKRLFTGFAASLILDARTNTDLLAQKIGVPLSFMRLGVGGWQGSLTPNVLSHMIPARGRGQEGFNVAEADLYTRSIQYIYRQDAVPWMRPDNMPITSEAAKKERMFSLMVQAPGKDPKPIRMFETLDEARAEAAIRQAANNKRVSRMVDSDKAAKETRTFSVQGGKYARAVVISVDMAKPADYWGRFLAELNRFMPSAGISRLSSTTAIVANFRDDLTGIPFGMTDEKFLAAIESFARQSGESLAIVEGKKIWVESKYGATHDWKTDPTGDSLLTQGSLAGRPDLHDWLRDRRDAFDGLLSQFSGDGLRYQQQLADIHARQSGEDVSLAARRRATVDASVIRAGSLGVAREYGTGVAGASRFTGVHFSGESRPRLSSRFYGTGMRGAEAVRVSMSEDDRLRHRVYFYVDDGNGIVPEAAVGDQIHGVILNNIYDSSKDPLKLRRRVKDANEFETAVADAGFDGVYFPNAISERGVGMGAIVLIGPRSVPVERKGSYNENVLRQTEMLERGEKLNARRRITPEQDAEYMAAVERGDMGAVQRMVDAAAKAAGYIYRVFHGTNAPPFDVFDMEMGGTKTGADSAQIGFFASDNPKVAQSYADNVGMGGAIDLALGGPLSAMRDKALETGRGKELKDAYLAAKSEYDAALKAGREQVRANVANSEVIERLKAAGFENEIDGFIDRLSTAEIMNGDWLQSPAIVAAEAKLNEVQEPLAEFVKDVLVSSLPNRRVLNLYAKMENPAIYDAEGKTPAEFSLTPKIQKAIRDGKDGVIFRNLIDPVEPSTHYVVFKSSQFKSADPVTRDRAGNVIPLSQRFDETTPEMLRARRRGGEAGDIGRRLTAARVALEEARKSGNDDRIREARKEFKAVLRETQRVARPDAPGLAFAMGRRAGQVAGMMRGRKVAAREVRDAEREKAVTKREEMRAGFRQRMAAMEERIEKAAAANDLLRQRMDRARRLAERRMEDAAERAERRALKGWFAAQAKGSRAGYDAAKREMVEIRRQAAEIIGTLPRRMRGRYVNALASMRTPSGIATVARRVMRDLHVAEAIETVDAINRLRKRVRKVGLRAETRGSITDDLNAAFAMLATGRRRLLPHTDTIDLRNRVQAARQLLANAQDRFDLEREEYRAGRDGRAEEISTDSRALGAAVSLLPALPQADISSQAPKRGMFRELLTEFLNMDAYTLMQRLEGGESGVLGKMWNQLKAGKNAMTVARRDIDAVIDRALRAAGYAGYDGYASRAAGLYGDSSAETATVRIGGRDMRIPVDMMLNIAAFDQQTIDLLTDEANPEERGAPIVFSTYRKSDPMFLTRQEQAAIVAGLTSEQRRLIDEMKAILEERIRPLAFEIHFQTMGRQPDMVPGYFPRQRLGDEIGDQNIDINMDPTQVMGTMLTNAGFLQQRVAARSTLVVSGMMKTMDSHIDESLRLIHLSLPLRYAMQVLKSVPVRTSMERVLGDGANDAIRKLVLNGVGLAGRPTNDLIERLNSNVSGALIALNPKTWMRQLGGAFRLGSEMPTAALAEGIARTTAMTPSQRRERAAYVEGLSGYMYDRHRRSQVGIFANVIGDPRTGTEQWVTALQSTGRSLSTMGEAAAAGQFMRAARALVEGGTTVGKIARSADGILRTVDRQIMLVAFEGHRADLKSRSPRMTDRELDVAAAALAEQSFRRTQNVSDSLDDTLYAAINKFNKGIGRVLFPFSSDPLKAHNQLRRAIMSRDPVQIGRTTAGLAGNMVLAAAVNPVWTLSAMAVASLFGGDEEDEEIVRRMLMEREMKYSGGALASDAASAVFGYAGIVGGQMVEAAMSSPEAADDAMEPLAIRMIGEAGKQAAAGRYGEVVGTAGQLAGIPVVSPIRTITRTVEAVRPAESKLLTEYRKRAREGTITPAQRRRMAELERRERARKALEPAG